MPDFKSEDYDGLVEGNAAQYTWMVPFKLKGVIDPIGGSAKVDACLESYFSQ